MLTILLFIIAPVALSGFPHHHHKPHPTPTAIPTATVLPTGIPTVQPRPTATPDPMRTALPSPVPTSPPQPSPSATIPPTRTPIPLPSTTPTSPPPSTCAGTSCTAYLLGLINGARAQAGVPPLFLNATQSNGTSTCVGSYGHSVHMAVMGVISHDQFPADICILYRAAGENVGVSSSGSEQTDIDTIQRMMMAEPHDPATCATTVNHACNEISPNFHQIGIGLYYSGGTTWLTTDFIG